MLKHANVVATIAVRDLRRARDFYQNTLGLTPVDSEEESVAAFKSGDSSIMVYESEYAGSNQATTATWIVGDQLSQVVEELKGQGVKFEHYDLPGTARKGDIHVSGETSVAWFKDPDGNILSLVNG